MIQTNKNTKILTWEDIYEFIKQRGETTIPEVRKHFNLGNDTNMYRKITGLSRHGLIEKNMSNLMAI